MVRFSCFNAHIPSHKSKKTVPTSSEAMYKSLQDRSQIESHKNSAASTLLINDNTSLSLIERGCKSGEMLKKSKEENDEVVHQKGSLKKCQSLGSGLYRGDNFFCNSDDDETDQVLSCDEARDLVLDNSKNEDLNFFNRYPENLLSESFQVSSGVMNNELFFSVGDPQNLEKGDDNFDAPVHDCVRDSGDPSPRSLPGIVRSSSLPNISHYTPIIKGSSPFKYLRPRSRSSEDLHVLEFKQKENSVHEVNIEVMRGKEKDDGLWESGNFNGEDLGDEMNDKFNEENVGDEAYDSYNYAGSSKDWIMPNQDEIKMEKTYQGESSSDQQWNELPNRDFKIKRIEAWVSNLHHCNSLEETDEPSIANDQGNRGSNGLKNLTNAKMDAKVTPGMEAAKRYISSLSASGTTTAQLANHGLVVVPFLSAFASLRVLNLSGNAIVRITAGALPRGLHMLNLSKNSISTIEGLRDVTRLRILDLSYNRILRIGHGLASCSSLKELYLAGNKISEVEGLHRLLKLSILDLRFNKISTTKSLGQLAANYNSLQAISLEGNPAQKNVGDDQLKKYLQGLLTQLVYYNRKPIKASILKDATDRSVRLGVSGTHGLKSDPKVARRGNHSTRKGPAVVSPKVTRGRRGQLPPSGMKVTTANHRNPYFEFGSKFLGLRQDLSMRRSRSEGTLGAL